MNTIKRFRVRSSSEIAWDYTIPLADTDARLERILHGVPVLVEHQQGEYGLFSDMEKVLTASDEQAQQIESLLEGLEKTLALIRTAQERLQAYLTPDSDGDVTKCIDDLLEIFDGPEQRATEGIARSAIAKSRQQAPAAPAGNPSQAASPEPDPESPFLHLFL